MQDNSQVRLARLEAKCRLLGRAGILFALIVGGVVVAAAKSEKMIEAEGLTLRSPAGDKVFEVRSDANGDIALVAFRSGIERIRLSVSKKGPEVVLNDSKGTARLRCFVDEDDLPGLFLMDPKTHKLRLLILSSGNPAIALDSKAGKTRAALALPGGLPRLRMFHENGETLWQAPE